MGTINTRPAEYKRAFEALTALLRGYPHGPKTAQNTIATPYEHESFPKGPEPELRSSRNGRARIHSDREKKVHSAYRRGPSN